MADYLATEAGDLLDAENGDNLILDVALPSSTSLLVIVWRPSRAPRAAVTLYRGLGSAESTPAGGGEFKAAYAQRINTVLIAGSPA